ncbi:MAG TPA: tRNA (adenosine(37)-N6)-threonylcarbamoyltransferase complex dimerization subunit type 1 TsaB [Caulobacteraceae bacterium]|nr:tRNA (adenosine(37)-N6)-threonylcarbamoyltransferase complex dimerization subunit type 1 TsaB [Caulobacteraceae bacterium]
MVLALDTALSACQAAVTEGTRVLALRSEPMERGHQERLAPLVAEAMGEAGLTFDRIDRIAVTVGPGSFTGVRVGLAFAKGLALALDRPCLGVGALEALAAGVNQDAFVAAAIDGRRDQIYLQVFIDRAPVMAPDSVAAAEAAARLVELYAGGPAILTGPGARLLEGMIAGARLDPVLFPDIAALAGLAAERPAPTAAPRPLYLRAPDARTLAERGASR